MKELEVELFIPGDLKNEPIISDMIRNFDVDIKIVEASFSSESGWAILRVNGACPEIDKMFEDIRSKGINVQLR
ncbi:MAG: NIL domain-containing protein [Candidatus Omnitrophica bacterium]|nr:NIL domain-containing protein [Candidatus Omnitrophota bacterium]